MHSVQQRILRAFPTEAAVVHEHLSTQCGKNMIKNDDKKNEHDMGGCY